MDDGPETRTQVEVYFLLSPMAVSMKMARGHAVLLTQMTVHVFAFLPTKRLILPVPTNSKH